MKIFFALNQATPEQDMQTITSAFPHEKVEQYSGVYKGQSEASYCIEGNRETLAWVLALAKEYNQESILLVSDSGKAGLLFCDSGEFVKLSGIWQQIDQSMTGYLDAYSEKSGQFYAVL
jgi:hypothetical protein